MKALLTNAPECTLKVNRMFSFEWIPLHFDFFYLMLRRLWTSYLSTWKLVKSFWQKQLTVKFRLSEKHTKFEKILMVLTNQLIYLVNVKTMRKIFFKLCLLLKKSELYQHHCELKLHFFLKNPSKQMNFLDPLFNMRF